MRAGSAALGAPTLAPVRVPMPPGCAFDRYNEPSGDTPAKLLLAAFATRGGGAGGAPMATAYVEPPVVLAPPIREATTRVPFADTA